METFLRWILVNMATLVEDSDPDPSAVSISLQQWDKLKLQVQTVVEENEMLATQEAILNKTIEDLTNQFAEQQANQTSQVSSLKKEKEMLKERIDAMHVEKEKLMKGMRELVQVFTSLEHRHKRKMKEMDLLYGTLQRKYDGIVELMQTRVDLWFHQHQLEMAAKFNKGELKGREDEINDLKNKIMAIETDKIELEMRLSEIEGSALHLHFQQLQHELKETKMKLSHCEIKAKVAGKQEQMHRATLARIIEAAEKGPVNGETIADIIREEHQASDALTHVYPVQDDEEHEDSCQLKNEGDNAPADGDKNNGDVSSPQADGDNRLDDAKEFIRELDLDDKGGNVVRQFQDKGDNQNEEDGLEKGGDEGDNVESEETDYEDAVTVIANNVGK